MKLYICWSNGGSDKHPCTKAYRALRAAGYDPEVQKARGSVLLPKFLQFKVRREVFALTGSYYVPVLLLDDGTTITHPDNIAAWAKDHPAK